MLKIYHSWNKKIVDDNDDDDDDDDDDIEDNCDHYIDEMMMVF